MGFFKIKKLLLFFSFLFLCGCSVDYTIEIKDDMVYENGNLIINKENIENKSGALGSLTDEIDYVYNNLHDIDNGQEEEKTRKFNLVKIDNNTHLGLKYEDIFKTNEYKNSPIIRQCYENVDIINNANYININTSSYFKCYDYYNYLDEVKVILKTDYNVTTNSDENKDNTYYWHINRENYKNKSINISILKNENISNRDTDKKINISNEYINLLLYVLILIIILLFFSIAIKVKKSNK